MTDTEHFTMHKSLTRFTSGNTKRRNKMNVKLLLNITIKNLSSIYTKPTINSQIL
jgi:hypothetical protein